MVATDDARSEVSVARPTEVVWPPSFPPPSTSCTKSSWSIPLTLPTKARRRERNATFCILAVAFESATVTEDCPDNRCGSLHLLYAGLLNWMKRCGVDDLPSET